MTTHEMPYWRNNLILNVKNYVIVEEYSRFYRYQAIWNKIMKQSDSETSKFLLNSSPVTCIYDKIE
jgi:hypothetical protein